MSSVPATVLETEAALQLGLLIQASGYELEVTPRKDGADLAAARNATIWATFHVDLDRQRPLFLRVGATVWGGARVATPFEVPWDSAPREKLQDFARDRLALACRRGREENPDHCETCPDVTHRQT